MPHFGNPIPHADGEFRVLDYRAPEPGELYLHWAHNGDHSPQQGCIVIRDGYAVERGEKAVIVEEIDEEPGFGSILSEVHTIPAQPAATATVYISVDLDFKRPFAAIDRQIECLERVRDIFAEEEDQS